jgi:transcriptional regulator with XRE-family HTH domain
MSERGELLSNIRIIREMKKLSREEVGSKIGLTPSGYGLVERGERRLCYDTLLKLAKVFDMDIIDVICFPDTPDEEKRRGQILSHDEYKDKYIALLEQFPPLTHAVTVANEEIKRTKEENERLTAEIKRLTTLLEPERPILKENFSFTEKRATVTSNTL